MLSLLFRQIEFIILLMLFDFPAKIAYTDSLTLSVTLKVTLMIRFQEDLRILHLQVAKAEKTLLLVHLKSCLNILEVLSSKFEEIFIESQVENVLKFQALMISTRLHSKLYQDG